MKREGLEVTIGSMMFSVIPSHRNTEKTLYRSGRRLDGWKMIAPEESNSMAGGKAITIFRLQICTL